MITTEQQDNQTDNKRRDKKKQKENEWFLNLLQWSGEEGDRNDRTSNERR